LADRVPEPKSRPRRRRGWNEHTFDGVPRSAYYNKTLAGLDLGRHPL